MAGNEAAFKRGQYQIMQERGGRPDMQFFNLAPPGDATKDDVMRLRRLFLDELQYTECLTCNRCDAMLTKMYFVEDELDNFCIQCFEKEDDLKLGPYMFVDMEIQNPALKGWKFGEEFEVLFLAYGSGIEDPELLSQSLVFGKKTADEIKKYFQMMNLYIPQQPQVELLRLPEKEVIEEKEKREKQEEKKENEGKAGKKKETWLQLFYRLKYMLDELDSSTLYYLFGEFYDRLHPEIKQPILKEFIKFVNFREQLYPFLQKLCQEYKARKLAITQSCSESSSESYEPQECRRKSKKKSMNKRFKKDKKDHKNVKKDKKDKIFKKNKDSDRSEVPQKAPDKRPALDKAPKMKKMKTKKITHSTSVQVSSSIAAGNKKSNVILKKYASLKPEKTKKLIKEL